MKYRIADLETGRVWYTDDQAEAYRLSYETDRYDVEEQSTTEGVQ